MGLAVGVAMRVAASVAEGLPWHTMPCRGACRSVPWGLPVAVGRAVLWWGLTWRVVVFPMAV